MTVPWSARGPTTRDSPKGSPWLTGHPETLPGLGHGIAITADQEAPLARLRARDACARNVLVP